MNSLTKLFICLSLLLMMSLAIATDFNKLANLANERYGEDAKKSIYELQTLLIELKSAPEIEKLKRINLFFNDKITFDDDMSVWGVSDYWATPLESIGKKRGDCEDFAIAKYVFLRSLDIPNERLKLTYVRAQIGGPHSKIFQAHMVLSYYATPTSEPLILDSLISDVREASRRVDLTPIFSFNSEGLWAGTANTANGTSLNNLSRWRNVLVRIQQDGIE
jgi:predicted transglutaminase-like cysteine proteinase